MLVDVSRASWEYFRTKVTQDLQLVSYFGTSANGLVRDETTQNASRLGLYVCVQEFRRETKEENKREKQYSELNFKVHFNGVLIGVLEQLF